MNLMSQKVRSVLLVTSITVFMGLGVPFAIWWAIEQRWILSGLLFVGMLCLGWPGYMLWISMWACKDIWHRWFLPPLFSLLLVSTCGLLGHDVLWMIGVCICGILLVISVIVMVVTVSSGTKE